MIQVCPTKKTACINLVSLEWKDQKMSLATSCLGLLKMLLVLSKKKCAFNFSSYKNSKSLMF